MAKVVTGLFSLMQRFGRSGSCCAASRISSDNGIAAGGAGEGQGADHQRILHQRLLPIGVFIA